MSRKVLLTDMNNCFVGDFNRDAVSLCKKILSDQVSFPVVLYGRTGLGKTFLMNATRAELEMMQKDAMVCMMSMDELCSEVISAMKMDIESRNNISEGKAVEKLFSDLSKLDYLFLDNCVLNQFRKDAPLVEMLMKWINSWIDNGVKLIIAVSDVYDAEKISNMGLNLQFLQVLNTCERGEILPMGRTDWNDMLAFKAKEYGIDMDDVDFDFDAACSINEIEGRLITLKFLNAMNAG